MCYSPVCHSKENPHRTVSNLWASSLVFNRSQWAFAFDLHVLGMPPAFILSQDQTLKKINNFNYSISYNFLATQIDILLSFQRTFSFFASFFLKCINNITDIFDNVNYFFYFFDFFLKIKKQLNNISYTYIIYSLNVKMFTFFLSKIQIRYFFCIDC